MEIDTGDVGGVVPETALDHSDQVEPSVDTACSYLVTRSPPVYSGASKAIDKEDTPGVEPVIVGAPGLSLSPKKHLDAVALAAMAGMVKP